MNLYQIDWKKLTEGLDDKALLFIEGCVEPAKPCEHGNYAPHDYLVEELSDKYGGMGIVAQCSGAAVGKDTDDATMG